MQSHPLALLAPFHSSHPFCLAHSCPYPDLIPRMCPYRFFLGSWNQSGFLAENRPTRTLREILERLRETYCGKIGIEVSLITGEAGRPAMTF